MRIRRCTWSTDRRPPHSVSGISPPLAFSDASSREAASSLSSGETVRGLPISACWMSASILCASSTSRVPSSKRRRERSSIDSISTRRPERFCSAMLEVCSPGALYWPAWAVAIWVFAAGAARIWSVSAPLSVTRVSGSHTVERMPIGASPRPAWSSMLVSAAERGAGPPNRASIACCWASPALRPCVPATGGARLKSGGMISGAARATWNSSGARRLPVSAAQPLVATAATSRTAVMALRMFDCLLGLMPFPMILTGEKGSQQQDHDRDANRRIADIEYQKRTESPEMKVGEVDDIAEADSVDDVAERSAQHHPERDLVEPVLLAPDPHRDADRDNRGHRHQHPPPDRVGRVQQAERDPLILGVGE